MPIIHTREYIARQACLPAGRLTMTCHPEPVEGEMTNMGLSCLEVWLRSKHDPALSYSGSFIVHYIEKIVYVEVSGGLILVLSILLCGMNALLYLRKLMKK